MKDRAKQLIEVLVDKTARDDERDDAAMDLGGYKDLRVLEALVKIASDPNENEMIVDSCAESIGDICVALKYFDEELFKKIVPFAQIIVFKIIMARNPELIKGFIKN